MATVSITIPDALVPRLKAAMHWRFPETAGMGDAAAFKAKTGEYWLAILVDYETGLAQQQWEADHAGVVAAARAQATTDGAGIG